LTTPKVIDFLEENNWKQQAKDCRQIVLKNYQRFCDLLKTHSICPISEEFLGQMASIPINSSNPLELKGILYTKHKIEIPILPLNGNFYLRYSINAYNSQEDLDVL
jgi:isopenicillin-N epimerase